MISSFELEQSLIEQRRYQKPLGQILLDRSLVSSEQLSRILQKQYWQKNGFWVIGQRILSRRTQPSFS
ncbi:MAG: hypothetical protein KME17_11820 [Cyanosarcina radialis HA8281-LM2]|nr:hypothetical protein [Cyanosarcina radialis HA8281-LM2]